ncbi:MAG: ThiF family adenylyltransferase [Anaerolineales bacterium]|jgi:molybdopterin/thiamine biosynthesis adenylyltransferase
MPRGMVANMYEELFERNFGVFTPEEQARIRAGKVVVIGCGGIGGVVTSALARSGLEHFEIFDYDTYEPNNINRQITCFTDTLGVNKAIATQEALHRINPAINITLHQRGLEPDEISEVIKKGDVVIPAADNWALSIVFLDTAKDLGVPAVMAYPVGALARVSVFLPESPYASECLVQPYRFPYNKLKAFMDNPDNRSILYYYRDEGAWTKEWFEDWTKGERPHAQLCPIVWVTGALAAMEMIKVISGRWQPVVAPHYWHITPTSARIKRFGLGRRLLSRICRRSWGQALLPTLANRRLLVKLFTRAIS